MHEYPVKYPERSPQTHISQVVSSNAHGHDLKRWRGYPAGRNIIEVVGSDTFKFEVLGPCLETSQAIPLGLIHHTIKRHPPR